MVTPPYQRKPPLWRRPALIYDEPTLARLKELGAIQCTVAQAASILGVRETHLARFFARYPSSRTVFEQGSAQALEHLRAAQFKLAQSSTSMAIFLGKQYLGQADRRELESSAQTAEDADAADAARRVRAKLAALVADPASPGNRQRGGEA